MTTTDQHTIGFKEYLDRCDLETPAGELSSEELIEMHLITSRLLGMLEGLNASDEFLAEEGAFGYPTQDSPETTALAKIVDKYLSPVRARATALDAELETRIENGTISFTEVS